MPETCLPARKLTDEILETADARVKLPDDMDDGDPFETIDRLL